MNYFNQLIRILFFKNKITLLTNLHILLKICCSLIECLQALVRKVVHEFCWCQIYVERITMAKCVCHILKGFQQCLTSTHQ